MPLPLTDPDTLLEELLQDLPPGDRADGTRIQSVCASQAGQDTWATLAGRLLLLWRGQIFARGGRHLDSPVRVYDGPSGGGALACLWSLGASEAAAYAPPVRRAAPAAGAALCRERRQP